MADISYIPPSSYQSPTLMGVIGNKAADMWAQEGQRLYQEAETNAQKQEAMANAPAISQAYAQGINKLYQGDTTGFHDLTQASAMSVGNPFLESMTRAATQQGVQAMDRWLAEQMAGKRQALTNENDLLKYDQQMDLNDAVTNRENMMKAQADQQRFVKEKADAANYYSQTGQMIPVAPPIQYAPLPQRQYLSQTMRKLHGQAGGSIPQMAEQGGGAPAPSPELAVPSTAEETIGAPGVGPAATPAAAPPSDEEAQAAASRTSALSDRVNQLLSNNPAPTRADRAAATNQAVSELQAGQLGVPAAGQAPAITAANIPASQVGPAVGLQAAGAQPAAAPAGGFAAPTPAKPVVAGLTDQDLNRMPPFSRPLGPQGPTVTELKDRTDLAPEGSNMKIFVFGADSVPKKTPVVEAHIGGKDYKTGGDENPIYDQIKNVREMFSGLTGEPLQALNDAMANTPKDKVPDIQMVPLDSKDKESAYKMIINGKTVNMIDPKASNLNPDQLKALPNQGLVPAVFPKDMGDKWRGVGRDRPVKADMDNLAKLGYFHIEPGVTQNQIDTVWQQGVTAAKNAMSSGGEDAMNNAIDLQNRAFEKLRQGGMNGLKDIRPEDIIPPAAQPPEVYQRLQKELGITMPGQAKPPTAMDEGQELDYINRRLNFLKTQQPTATGPDLNDINAELVDKMKRKMEIERTQAARYSQMGAPAAI